MWHHHAGQLDFDKPLLQLLRRGWGFREYAPIIGVDHGGCWAVIAVRGAERVRVDHAERREAWAELVRIALVADPEPGPV